MREVILALVLLLAASQCAKANTSDRWLVMHDWQGNHLVAQMSKQECEREAQSLNAKAGPHRGLHWTCERTS